MANEINQVKVGSTTYTLQDSRVDSLVTGVSSVNGQTGDVTIGIPTVNNGTLTIQKNSTSVGTFTANQSGNTTANITVPTKVSELTNDSKFVTADQNMTIKWGGSISTNPAWMLAWADSGSTIQGVSPSTITAGNATKLNGQAASYYAAASSVPTKTSQLQNDSGYITSSGIPTKLANTTGGYLHCGNDGVTETGEYLDMHFTEADSLDYSTRLRCGGDYKNTVTLPSTSGTLATVSFSNGVLTITQ